MMYGTNNKFMTYLNYAFLGMGIFMIVYGVVSGHYITMVFGFLMIAFPVYRIYTAYNYKKLQSAGSGKDWRESAR